MVIFFTENILSSQICIQSVAWLKKKEKLKEKNCNNNKKVKKSLDKDLST